MHSETSPVCLSRSIVNGHDGDKSAPHPTAPIHIAAMDVEKYVTKAAKAVAMSIHAFRISAGGKPFTSRIPMRIRPTMKATEYEVVMKLPRENTKTKDHDFIWDQWI